VLLQIYDRPLRQRCHLTWKTLGAPIQFPLYFWQRLPTGYRNWTPPWARSMVFRPSGVKLLGVVGGIISQGLTGDCEIELASQKSRLTLPKSALGGRGVLGVYLLIQHPRNLCTACRGYSRSRQRTRVALTKQHARNVPNNSAQQLAEGKNYDEFPVKPAHPC
jgi:hypothetical protein